MPPLTGVAVTVPEGVGCGAVVVEGAETFAGHAFHSADWDHDYELRGKRVAVVDADVWGYSIPRMLGVTRAPTGMSTISGPFSPTHVAPPLARSVPAARRGSAG